VGASEGCDDGGAAGGDGCDQACQVELGFFCAQATPAASPQPGSTAGLADRFSGSCTGEAAPEALFTLTPGAPGQTGTLSLTLTSATDQGLYVRASCEDAASELGCEDARVGGEDELLSVAVQGGAPVAIFVDGFAPGEEGPFTLSAAFSPDVCGDGQKTGLEGCDDGGTAGGDGCDQACRIELDLSEAEPNDSAAAAEPFAAPFAGEVSPAGDVDFVSVTLGAAGDLTAEISDVGDGGCAARRLDSVVTILGPDGQELLAEDDDSGPGLCSRARAAGLPAGSYFVRVSAFRAGDTFPYRLSLTSE
jgi:cysteine-rich repeat protein